jgi:hypothetical protein
MDLQLSCCPVNMTDIQRSIFQVDAVPPDRRQPNGGASEDKMGEAGGGLKMVVDSRFSKWYVFY